MNDRRSRLLDLFCGAGGAAMGYKRAGFHVTGVDVKWQRHYAGDEFIQGDAMTYPLDGYDAIHASPPCQRYSIATAQRRAAGTEYPDLLAPTRERLQAQCAPWVIENVPLAPMRKDVVLCGCMFALPLLRRERWFEMGNWVPIPLTPPHWHSTPALSITGHGVGAGNGQGGRIAKVLARNPGIADVRRAMGIDWMNRDELSQAIPPAYTEWIGLQLIRECADCMVAAS